MFLPGRAMLPFHQELPRLVPKHGAKVTAFPVVPFHKGHYATLTKAKWTTRPSETRIVIET